ncbi:MAG: metallophosphoesterase family protein [Myxococcota bacterium]
MRVGVISDTHGLLRPEALRALDGADHLLHAGDVGHPDVLTALAQLAPLTAIRGNVDEPAAVRRSRRRNKPDPAWAQHLPDAVTVTLAGVPVHLVHDRKALTVTPPVRVVVSGHSHQPALDAADGVLFLNPGSAGPRRFSLPVTVAWLDLSGPAPRADIVPLPLVF